jgi:hypothetical protein
LNSAPNRAKIQPVNPTQRQILKQLEKLKPGATICPGQLARKCGSTLAKIRSDLLDLAQAKKIVLSQRGQTVSGANPKGPFRVRAAGTP